jgi:mono/diheme cytochrome c family protein
VRFAVLVERAMLVQQFSGDAMKRLSWSGLLLLAAIPAAEAQSLIQRGEYLVNAVMACDGCHTPRGPGGFNMARRFSGGAQVWDEPAYIVRGSNITQDRETGIGGWSVVELKRLMVDGVRPNGTAVAPQMPYGFYKVLTAGDLEAVVTYVRTIAPVRNEMPPPVYKATMQTELVPGGEKPAYDTALKDPVKRGFYLATIAHCMECHSKRPEGRLDFKGHFGKGGYVMKGPFGAVTVSNISSHPTAGIGAWSDADIKRALTESIGRDGRNFKTPMERHMYYSRMTPADLDAVVKYVRTIPPIE